MSQATKDAIAERVAQLLAAAPKVTKQQAERAAALLASARKGK